MKLISHDEQGRKRCSRCHEYKPLEQYHHAKGRADGYSDKCKSCRSKAENPELAAERREKKSVGLKWCPSCKKYLPFGDFYFLSGYGRYTPYCKTCERIKANTYRGETNYNRKYYEANISRERVRGNNWRRENPDRRTAQKQKRRARVKNADGHFTVREWESLKAQYDFTCLCCGKHEPEIKLEPDHVVPLSTGGTNYISNIQPLCRSCNSRKNNKIVDYRRKIC